MIYKIGQHKIMVGNIVDGIDNLMLNEKAYIVYTDPPWSQGNLKWWEKKLEKDTGNFISNNYVDIIEKLFNIVNLYCQEWFFLEFSVKNEFILNNLNKINFKLIDIKTCLYKGGGKYLPFKLHIFSKTGKSNSIFSSILKTDKDYDVVKKAVYPIAKQNEILLDPFSGLGNSFRVAIETGMIYRGNEINEKRVLQSLKIYEKYGRNK